MEIAIAPQKNSHYTYFIQLSYPWNLILITCFNMTSSYTWSPVHDTDLFHTYPICTIATELAYIRHSCSSMLEYTTIDIIYYVLRIVYRWFSKEQSALYSLTLFLCSSPRECCTSVVRVLYECCTIRPLTASYLLLYTIPTAREERSWLVKCHHK